MVPLRRDLLRVIGMTSVSGGISLRTPYGPVKARGFVFEDWISKATIGRLSGVAWPTVAAVFAVAAHEINMVRAAVVALAVTARRADVGAKKPLAGVTGVRRISGGRLAGVAWPTVA